MSLKENIDMVKEELNSEEKFFEKAVVTERFVKKYKKPIIGAVVVLIALVAGNFAYEVSEQNRVESANATLALLQQDPTNEAARTKLKALSPVLYDVWNYSVAVTQKRIEELEKLKSSQALIVHDTAAYEAAQNKGSVAELSDYAGHQDAIYKDLAAVLSAVLLMQEGKITQAHNKLALIGTTSPLLPVVQSLQHYGVK